MPQINPRIELAAKDEALLARINDDAHELGVALRANLIPTEPAGALACLILTPHIREYLEQNDPMALKQARGALHLQPAMCALCHERPVRVPGEFCGCFDAGDFGGAL